LVAAVARDFSAQLRQAWQKGRMRLEKADRGNSRLDPSTWVHDRSASGHD